MVEQLTRGWASEFGRRGIRVNTITPGLIDSDPGTPGSVRRHEMAADMPAGRAGSVEDIAAAAAYLAGDDAAYLHGTALVVDGGALGTRS